MPCLQDALRREEYSKQGFMIAPSQGLEAGGARRLWNESFFSAPQLKRDSLGGWRHTIGMKITQLFLSFLLLVPAHGLTQAPPLSKADFALGGVAEGMDSATVRRRLGKP